MRADLGSPFPFGPALRPNSLGATFKIKGGKYSGPYKMLVTNIKRLYTNNKYILFILSILLYQEIFWFTFVFQVYFLSSNCFLFLFFNFKFNCSL